MGVSMPLYVNHAIYRNLWNRMQIAISYQFIDCCLLNLYYIITIPYVKYLTEGVILYAGFKTVHQRSQWKSLIEFP